MIRELIRKWFCFPIEEPEVQDWAQPWPHNKVPSPPPRLDNQRSRFGGDWGGPFVSDAEVIRAFKKGGKTWANLIKQSPRYADAIPTIQKFIASGAKPQRPSRPRSPRGITAGDDAIWGKTVDAQNKVKLHPDSPNWPEPEMESLHPAYAVLGKQPEIKQINFSPMRILSVRENSKPTKGKSRKKTKKRK